MGTPDLKGLEVIFYFGIVGIVVTFFGSFYLLYELIKHLTLTWS